MKNYCIVLRRNRTPYIQSNKTRLNGLITPYIGTTFYSMLFKGRWEECEEGGEDISSYWMTTRK